MLHPFIIFLLSFTFFTLSASEFVGETIPIIDRQTNVLQGVVNEADIFQAYLKLQNNVIDLETK